MARRFLGPRYEPPARHFDGKSALDNLLEDAQTAINGYQTLLPDQFDKAVEEIEANEELSPVGKARKLKKLVEQFENHEYAATMYDPWIARAEAEVARLESEIKKRPFVEPTGTHAQQTAELLARENRKHRRLLDYRMLSDEEKLKIQWAAIDKAATSQKARDTLLDLMDDEKLDAEMERRANAAIRAGANPEAARALGELVGRTDHTGREDGSGALVIAKYARDAFRRYLRERTGVDLSLEQLAEQHQVPKPLVEGKVMRLSRAAASNMAVMLAAQAEAEAKGLQLEVEPIAASPFGNGVGEGDE